MKHKLMMVGLVGFAFLFGCNQISESEVKANIPESYKVVAKTEIAPYTNAIELVHVVTKCHYTYVNGDRDGGIAQMFIEKDGSSVPYCDK